MVIDADSTRVTVHVSSANHSLFPAVSLSVCASTMATMPRPSPSASLSASTVSSALPGSSAVGKGGAASVDDVGALLCSLAESGSFSSSLRLVFERQYVAQYPPVLQQSIAAKDGRIRAICHEHYLDFLSSVDSLMAVQGDMGELRSSVRQLNTARAAERRTAHTGGQCSHGHETAAKQNQRGQRGVQAGTAPHSARRQGDPADRQEKVLLRSQRQLTLTQCATPRTEHDSCRLCHSQPSLRG